MQLARVGLKSKLLLLRKVKYAVKNLNDLYNFQQTQ